MAILPGVLGCRTLQRTVKVRLGSNTLRFSGGTAIFAVSPQQFMEHPGYYASLTTVICLFHIAQENAKICSTHGRITGSITVVGENIHVGAIPA